MLSSAVDLLDKWMIEFQRRGSIYRSCVEVGIKDIVSKTTYSTMSIKRSYRQPLHNHNQATESRIRE